MYLVRVTPLMNFTFSDDSLFLKKNLGGGHKFSEFACCLFFHLFFVFHCNIILIYCCVTSASMETKDVNIEMK